MPQRFSPASAGNSGPFFLFIFLPSVQPRECGELEIGISERIVVHGSAPRVRGTRRRGIGGSDWGRFSPASAGNSTGTSWLPILRSVQPRECGELTSSAAAAVAKAGSAPRVRGTPKLMMSIQERRRFSPASAGNSWQTDPNATSATVQPRECGELAGVDDLGIRISGSAPRVRGTRRPTRRLVTSRRFSPASAGNSPSSTNGLFVPAVQPRECGELYSRNQL